QIPNPKSIDGCEKCGASPEDIDAEGYCSNCGFRNQSRENDRIEVICSPHLGGVSDRGLRHHRNEDYLACAAVDGRQAYVLVVCDGVSSSQEPDLAAKAAAESACMTLKAVIEKGDTKGSALPGFLREAMKKAIASALASVSAIPYITGADADLPSTTIVAAVVQGNTATIGWLGDSRAYWISPNGSQQLTQDDSWLNDVVASGQMTEAEAGKSDLAHAITRWLGADAIADSEPSIVNFDIPGSGYLLLCTDGLWNYASETTQIEKIVKSRSDADAVSVARGLVEFARSQGGHDNITVALLSL
ncbi:MAG TPA: serine/threonine protein phosphatase, partial [Cyanobacteria bacterium UBA8553]|nr:serine/threonine protein phosphatase [Cyanobacteria bacterium UBA8553]